MTVRVAAFVQLRRTVPPTTGVGKHIGHMVRGLAGRPGVALTVLAAADDLGPGGVIPAANTLAGLPARRLPARRKVLEVAWKAVGRPAVDRWCPPVDWVYCPAEAVVPVRAARLAVTVHDVHAFEPGLPWSRTARHRAFRAAWAAMFRQLRRRAALYLAVSEFTKRRLAELAGVDPAAVAVVGNGVEDEFFAAGPPAPPPAAPYLLVVGGLSARKGGDVVLRAAAAVARRAPGLTVRVAGANDPGLAAEAARAGNVALLGPVPQDRLPGLYRGAAALLFPSRYEGFGIPVLEAMAAGTPVVCSDHPALAETAGGAAVLVPGEDAEGAADAALRVWADPAARADLVARGRARAAGFRWAGCVDRLVAALGPAG